VADKTIPRKEKKNESSWMSQDTLKVVENRRNMKMEGNSERVRKLNGEIQKRIRKDKENYLKRRELEEHSKKGRTKELHQHIREIRGKPKRNTGMLKSRTGIDYIEINSRINNYKIEGIHRETLQEGPKHISALPGPSIYTGTNGDEIRSYESPARNNWK